MLTKVGALSSRQLGSNSYVNELRKKLSEADVDQSVLARRLAEVENKLKGDWGYPRGGAWPTQGGEGWGCYVLEVSRRSKGGLGGGEKKSWRGHSCRISEVQGLNDEAAEYFIRGFESLYRQLLRVRPDLNLSGFKADVEFESTRTEVAEWDEGELEKDGET